MNPAITIAIRAARSAGDLIVRHIQRVDTLVVTAKARNDFVTEVDRMAEQEIIRILRRAYPGHGILAEESGEQPGRDTHVWVIDPLDGTTNFLHGFPQYAVSIALKAAGRVEQAVIYDPLRQELFVAGHGEGARLDDRRIRVSRCHGLDSALIGTGFPFKYPEHLDAYLSMFRTLLGRASDLRLPGAASLDLAYVAAGRLDGFWEIGLKEWDMAAGTLLIREAGGLVGDFSAGPDYLTTGNVIAGPPKVFRALVSTIAPHRTPALQR